MSLVAMLAGCTGESDLPPTFSTDIAGATSGTLHLGGAGAQWVVGSRLVNNEGSTSFSITLREELPDTSPVFDGFVIRAGGLQFEQITEPLSFRLGAAGTGGMSVVLVSPSSIAGAADSGRVTINPHGSETLEGTFDLWFPQQNNAKVASLVGKLHVSGTYVARKGPTPLGFFSRRLPTDP